jgi:hypothetical protein
LGPLANLTSGGAFKVPAPFPFTISGVRLITVVSTCHVNQMPNAERPFPSSGTKADSDRLTIHHSMLKPCKT